MSNFKEFINDLKKSALTTVSSSLQEGLNGALSSVSASDDDKQNFFKEVNRMVQDEDFLTELSEDIDKPLKDESEDDFVKRSSDILRKMLYKKFDISN